MKHLFSKNIKGSKNDVRGYYVDCITQCTTNCDSTCSSHCRTECKIACDSNCETSWLLYH